MKKILMVCEAYGDEDIIGTTKKSLYLQGFRAWLSLFRTDFYVRLGKPITPVNKVTGFWLLCFDPIKRA